MSTADAIPPEAVRLRPEQLDERLLRYEVVREVGHGSMGLVYEARQQGVARRVAIKVLPPHLALRERTVRRFLREAAAMGRLSHPRVVDIFEVESSGDLHYFAMRFVEGPPLDRVLRAGPLAISDVVSIGVDVAGALAHAHARGVMHRDIKPANLLRDGDHVVLTDFGLARPLDGRETGTMTESGDLVGTPLYMAPEQIAGELDGIDGRCDVWGLGATLYELLAQRPPFTGPSAQAILNNILAKEPQRLRKLRDDVPPDLEAVVLKCLEKDLSRRYSGAAALLSDLEALRDGRPVSARTPRFFDPAVRWVRRRPVESVVALVLALLVVAFARSAQESSRALDTARDDLSSTQSVARAARREVDRVQLLREEAHAREQILEARILWASGGARDRRQAQANLEYLLAVYSFEEHPGIALDAMETYASWMHDQGRDGEVLGLFDELAPARPDATAEERADELALRAAMWTGLERYREALAAHRERARLVPRDPGPFLDAAGILRRMAEAQRAALREEQRLASLHAALRFHADALTLAIPADDRECITDVLIERARCWLDLGLPDRALTDLDQVLALDSARADARALHHAARSGGPSPALEEPAPAEPTATVRSPLSLDALDPGDLDTTDLREAGEGIRVLFRGLGELLGNPGERSAADDPTDAPSLDGG